MKKKVVENQKISIYISVNVCNRGDERSWIYGIEAKFLIEDCKLEIIYIPIKSIQIPKKLALIFYQMNIHLKFHHIHA